jgi:hypothetical protein
MWRPPAGVKRRGDSRTRTAALARGPVRRPTRRRRSSGAPPRTEEALHDRKLEETTRRSGRPSRRSAAGRGGARRPAGGHGGARRGAGWLRRGAGGAAAPGRVPPSGELHRDVDPGGRAEGAPRPNQHQPADRTRVPGNDRAGVDLGYVAAHQPVHRRRYLPRLARHLLADRTARHLLRGPALAGPDRVLLLPGRAQLDVRRPPVPGRVLIRLPGMGRLDDPARRQPRPDVLHRVRTGQRRNRPDRRPAAAGHRDRSHPREQQPGLVHGLHRPPDHRGGGRPVLPDAGAVPGRTDHLRLP